MPGTTTACNSTREINSHTLRSDSRNPQRLTPERLGSKRGACSTAAQSKSVQKENSRHLQNPVVVGELLMIF